MQSYDPWHVPENPFNYRGLVSHPQGLGNIPQARFGEKIAIIGAGCSGLGAAFELMKIGLHPVVYEADSRIGGRAFTFQFPGDPRALAEIGAMRIPPTHRTLTYYLDTFGIDYHQPFPDPLVVPTTLYFEGKKHFIPVGGELPPDIQRAKDKWQAVINPLVDKMARVWHDPECRNRQWQEFVKTYADKSFFEVLRENGLSPLEIKLFGMLGLGTGGFDSLYRISFLEILRLKVCKWEDDQRLIRGGSFRLPWSFWSVRRNCFHWGEMSVQSLNNSRPHPTVKEMYTPPDPSGKVKIVDIYGNAEKYAAVIVTCSPRALEMDININRELFQTMSGWP
jgi:hypothetical protein